MGSDRRKPTTGCCCFWKKDRRSNGRILPGSWSTFSTNGPRENSGAGHFGYAATSSARDVRPGNDQGDGLLPRHRELLTAFHGTHAGRASAYVTRLFSARFSAFHRRVASDRSATARHVSRRPVAQADAGRVRI